MSSGYSLTGVLGQDEGVPIGSGATLNFTGAGVTATSSGGVITVDVPGGGGGAGGWTDGGTAVYLSTSTDVVSIGSNTPVTNRKLSVYNTGTNLGVSVVTLASSDNVISTFVSGEANLRYSVDGGGSTVWGAGGASAQDVRLYRSGTSALTVDDGSGGSAGLSILGTTSMQRTQYQTVTTAATPYAVTATDNIVFANSAVAQTINLPAAAAGLRGRTITVKRIGINAPTVTVASLGGLIDGALNRSLNNYDSITVVCDGSNWWVI
jgi:hypothetical protein